MNDNSIDPTRRRDASVDVADHAPIDAGAKPAGAAARTPEIPALPDTNGALLAKAVRSAATEQRVDAFLDATTPAYHTPEGDVRVAAPYRQPVDVRTYDAPGQDGAPQGIVLYREQSAMRHTPELRAIAARVGISEADLRLVQRGGGDPEHVRRLTQGLIDAGRLPAKVLGDYEPRRESHDLGLRVRAMMAEYGLGYDEAGYVRQAIAHVAPGKTALARVSLATARPGDVFAAVPGTPVGILRRQREASAAEEAELRKKLGFGTGHIVAYEVDSSHSDVLAELDHGGVARETWWHDEDTGAWRTLASTGEERTFAPFDAVYRPVAP
jgi:hypothetical protein